METLEHFQQSRAVIEDFSSRTLAAIPSDFGRLHYISSLRDSRTGGYQHDGLAALYSEGSVQEALSSCHQELFSRILETPLKEQESDLRRYLGTFGDKFWGGFGNQEKNRDFRMMCPEGLPEYLRDLFCSNMGVLRAVLCPSGFNQTS